MSNVPVEAYSQENHEEIEALLLGRTVTKVAEDKLLLDDGTELTLTGNEGCGGCTNGEYNLTELNGVDNVITKVEFVNDPDGDRSYNKIGVYQIFVYADNVQVNLAHFIGSDDNGYYGTGYSITVRRVD